MKQLTKQLCSPPRRAGAAVAAALCPWLLPLLLDCECRFACSRPVHLSSSLEEVGTGVGLDS